MEWRNGHRYFLESADAQRKSDLGNYGSYLQGTTASLWSLAAFFMVFVAFLLQQKQLFQQHSEIEEQGKQFQIQMDAQEKALAVMQENSKNQNLVELIKYLQSPEVRNARHHVLSKLKSKPLDLWEDDDRQHASTACSGYGVAGVLIQSGRVDGKIIHENWGGSIRDIVEVCDSFIKERRRRNGALYDTELLRLYEDVRRIIDTQKNSPG